MSETERAAWAGLLRTAAVLTQRCDDTLVERHGLRVSEYEVLLILAESPEPLRATELTARTILTPGGVTRLIDRLVDRGLVERLVCTTDKRGVLIGLTDTGRELFRAAGRDHLADIRSLFLSHLEPDETEILAAVFERVLERA